MNNNKVKDKFTEVVEIVNTNKPVAPQPVTQVTTQNGAVVTLGQNNTKKPAK